MFRSRWTCICQSKSFERVTQRAELNAILIHSITKFGVVAALSRQIMQQASGKAFSNDTPDHSLPVLVFWHGGGMVGGNREAWLPHWLFSEWDRFAAL